MGKRRYKPINGWTKPEILKALELGNQGISRQGNYSCAYRGLNGNKCPVGVFIPDDVYHASCEGEDVGYLLDRFPGLSVFMPLPLEALTSLQAVHDLANHPHSDFYTKAKLLSWVERNVL